MNTLPSYLTLVIALMVAWVGFQQFVLARERFKLELFEKRFAVYKATQKFLSAIMRDPNISFDIQVEFLRDTQNAVFLFGEEIVTYIDSLYNKSVDMTATQKQYRDLPVGDQRSALCEKEVELIKQLTGELKRLKDVFAPYLRFKVWKREAF